MVIYQPFFFGADDLWKIEALKNFSYPAHMHRCIEWIYVVKGNVDITCGEQHYILSEGDSIVFMPNVVHSFDGGKESEFIYLCFSPELVPAFIAQTESSEPVSPVFKTDNGLLPLILTLKEEADIPKLKIKGLLYMLCSDFQSKTEWKPSPKNDPSLMHKIISFIQQHFSEDISLYTISQQFGYDYHYLSRYLKNKLNVPFSKYLTQYRISHACFLLRERGCSITEVAQLSGYSCICSITEVAQLSGYSCIRSFNKAFKSVTGLSPRDYKRSSGV